MTEHRPGGDESKLDDRLSAIEKAMYNFDETNKLNDSSEAFICREDLKKIWRDTQDIKAIIPSLSEIQINTVKREFILLSFLVLYMRIDWFDKSFIQVIFEPDGALRYKNDSLPLSEETLIQTFGMQKTIARKAWKDQYCFIPINIHLDSQNDSIQIIPEAYRLQLIKKPEELFRGGFGEVQCYDVAPKKRNSAGKRISLAVAVKKFRVIEHGLKEVKNMQFLKQGSTKNDNVCLHTAILQIGNTKEMLIVFPQADHGTLDMLFCAGCRHADNESLSMPSASTWNSPKKRVYNLATKFPIVNDPSRLAIALKDQTLALCEALRFLHNGFTSGPNPINICVHMDLKPDNVLIFAGGDVGTWKLCDFGISKIDNELTRKKSGSGKYMYTMDAKVYRMKWDYTAPEIHNSRPQFEAKAGRSGDMWSFGCLFSEVLAFSLNPENGVLNFRKERAQKDNDVTHSRFYSVVQQRSTSELAPGDATRSQHHTSYEVSKQVEQWFNGRQRFQETKPWVSHWIKCIKSCLVIEADKRTSARRLIRLIWESQTVPSTNDLSPSGIELPDNLPQSPHRIVEPSSRTPDIRVDQYIAYGTVGQTGTVASFSHTTSEMSTSQYGAGGEDDVSNFYISSNSSNVYRRESIKSTYGGPSRQLSVIATRSDHIMESPPALDTESIASADPAALVDPDDKEVGHQGEPARDVRVPKPLPLPDACRGKLPIYENNLANEDAISVALDDTRIVCLTSNSLRSFHISNLLQSEAPRNLLPRDDPHCWTHVTVAGEYILLIGKDESSEMCKYRIFSYITGTTSAGSWEPHPQTIPFLPLLPIPCPGPRADPKKIALSKGGLIAVADQNCVQVRSPSRHNGFVKLRVPSEFSHIEIVDIRFNLPKDEKDFLYVWAHEYERGLLLIYKMFETTYRGDLPMHQASFQYLPKEEHTRHTTYIIPLNNYQGCVIAFSSKHYFPYAPYCNIADRNGDGEDMRNFEYAYIRGDNSLVAVKSLSPNWPWKQIKEYTLIYNHSSIQLGESKQLAQFWIGDTGMVNGARVMLKSESIDTLLVYKRGRKLKGYSVPMN